MRKDDLMKPDLLSEVLLLVSGIVLGLTLAMIAILAFTHTAATQ